MSVVTSALHAMNPHTPTTNQRIARAWALLAVLGLLLWLTQRARGAENEVTVSFEPQFRGLPLVFDQLRFTHTVGQALAITRLDLLLSGLAVRRTNGTWLEQPYWFAFLSGRAGRTNFALRELPPGNYDRLRFSVGVPAEQNLGNPAQWEATHPLNPQVSGLHWNWQGGYVFLALEGNFTPLQPPAEAPNLWGRLGVNQLAAIGVVSRVSHPSPAVPLATSRGAKSPVGRDSVEPHLERSEASAASISGKGTPNQDARYARASSVGKQGSTESHPTYATMFTRAFGTPDITAERIGLALEQFLLTLTSHAAKFDRVLRGEEKFTEQEQRGFELFHSEHDPRRGQFGADCFHCHGGPLFQNVAFSNNGLDANPADLGRYLVTGREGDKGKFSVPSLRNVELTAPYMHDGRFPTLEDAVFHYVRGVRRSPTLDPNLAKHPPGGVRLPPEDLRALVAFLKTLTEEPLRPVARSTAPPP